MAADGSVQSLDRGLEVLRLLSRTPVMTATAIAAALGVHQSSASRLLGSLLKAGFVRKPDFHSFALDYGALVFAGHALHCFPEIHACTHACNHIGAKFGFRAAAGVLREGRVLYLTQIHDNASISILDDSEFPLHRSSIGLILACEKETSEALALIEESILRWDRHNGVTRPNEEVQAEAARVQHQTVDNLGQHGYFYQTDSPLNAINGSCTVCLNGEPTALAVYHTDRTATVAEMRAMLKDAVALIGSEYPQLVR